jgi:F-type H+-transporting ATPase subunit a
MATVDLLEGYWQPFKLFGLESPFFNVNKEVVFSTWILLGMLFILCLPVRFFLRGNYPVIRFLIVKSMDSFAQLLVQTLGVFSFNHFAFITSLFLYIFVGSLLSLIPGLEEPASNINTTLALGIVSFLYIQVYTIKEYGLWGYVKKEYLSPILMLPLHIIGKLASIISLSFRLFGNIFGGATVAHIYFDAMKSHWLVQAIAFGTGLNFLVSLFFGIFEGFLQAFVFSMLTLTYLSISLEEEAHESEGNHP